MPEQSENSWFDVKVVSALSKAEIDIPSGGMETPRIEVFGQCVGEPPNVRARVHMHAKDQFTVRVKKIGGWMKGHLEYAGGNKWRFVEYSAS